MDTFAIRALKISRGSQVIPVLPITIENYGAVPRTEGRGRLNWQVARDFRRKSRGRLSPIETAIGSEKIAHCFGAPNFLIAR